MFAAVISRHFPGNFDPAELIRLSLIKYLRETFIVKKYLNCWNLFHLYFTLWCRKSGKIKMDGKRYIGILDVMTDIVYICTKGEE